MQIHDLLIPYDIEYIIASMLYYIKPIYNNSYLNNL